VDQLHNVKRNRQQLIQLPSSKQSFRLNALISVLQVEEVGYDLEVFGGILALIPQRQGNHQALDDASWAFACAYRSVPSSCRSPKTIAAYVTALASVRKALGESGQVSADLLAAIYMVTLCSVSSALNSLE
jgi:hypothetical protein